MSIKGKYRRLGISIDQFGLSCTTLLKARSAVDVMKTTLLGMVTNLKKKNSLRSCWRSRINCHNSDIVQTVA